MTLNPYRAKFFGMLSSFDTLVGAVAFFALFAAFVGQTVTLYGNVDDSLSSALSTITANAGLQEAVNLIKETGANHSAAKFILNHYLGQGNYAIGMLPLPENHTYSFIRIVAIRTKLYYIGVFK